MIEEHCCQSAPMQNCSGTAELGAELRRLPLAEPRVAAARFRDSQCRHAQHKAQETAFLRWW